MSETPLHESLRFAVLLAATGGCLDAYSVLNASVFAGAQTGNLTISRVHLAAGDWGELFQAGLPIVMYAGVSAIGVGFGLKPFANLIRNPLRAALVVEALLLVLAGTPSIAASTYRIIALLALAAGVQMAVFPTVRKWGYSTMVGAISRNG